MQNRSLAAGDFTFAVGGLYGRLDVLGAILGEVSARCETGTVVFLGNYGALGGDASDVVERLRGGPPTGWRWICLRGSQEQELLARTMTPSQTPPHSDIEWFASLPSLHADPHRVYVHAALDEAFGLMEQPPETTFYGLYLDDRSGGYRQRHVVHAYAPSARTPARTSVEQFGYGAEGTAVAMFDDAKPGGPEDIFTVNRNAGRRLPAAQESASLQAQRTMLRSALAFEESQLEGLRRAIRSSSLNDVQRALWPARVLNHQQAIFDYRWQLASLDTFWP